MKTLRKTSSLALLGAIIFSWLSLFAPLQAQAQTACAWEEQKQFYNTTTNKVVTTDCSSGKSAFPDNTCATTKPVYTSAQGVAVTAVCCCQASTQSSATTTPKAPKYEIPELQVKIPGLTFSDVTCTNETGRGFVCSVYWISDYIGGIYQYALGIGGILAAVMLMIGGVLWLVSGGDASKVSKAKTTITGSITGLVILFASYTLLYQINPDLTVFQPITLGYKSTGSPVPGGSGSTPSATTQSCLSNNQLFDITNIPGIVKGANLSDPRLSKDSYDALVEAAKLAIDEGYTLTITSANRTYEKQVELWDKQYEIEKNKNPTKTEAEIISITKGKVSHPDNCMPPNCGGHCGGVAVDLCFTGNCLLLNFNNMGHKDASTEKLEEIMNKAGWGRYCKEWWHFQTDKANVPCS